MLDLRQTLEYANFMENIGWIVERIDGVNYFIRRFPLVGSFIKIQRPEKINYQHVAQLAVKHRAFQIVIEPKYFNHQKLIYNWGFRQSRSPFLPTKTIHIDLSKSEKTLLEEMHYKTRYNIRKTQNSKLKIQNSKDIETFADFWQRCALKQRGMFLSQKKEITTLFRTFGKWADLILVSKDKEILSGILMVKTKNIAYYMYAASSPLGKKLFAPTLNVWQAILLAKKAGCKVFDFEGVYDERFPLKSWKGFTRFKKSFGGKEIEYPGAFVKYRLPRLGSC